MSTIPTLKCDAVGCRVWSAVKDGWYQVTVVQAGGGPVVVVSASGEMPQFLGYQEFEAQYDVCGLACAQKVIESQLAEARERAGALSDGAA